MQIDFTALTHGRALKPADLAKLSSQMLEILTRLQVSPGRSILVEIKSLSAISVQERATLLKQTPQQGSLTQLLQNPKSQLVELRFRQQSFYVITDLALQPGQKLLVTARPDAFSYRQAQPSPPANTQPPNPLASSGRKPAQTDQPAQSSRIETHSEPSKFELRRGRDRALTVDTGKPHGAPLVLKPTGHPASPGTDKGIDVGLKSQAINPASNQSAKPVIATRHTVEGRASDPLALRGDIARSHSEQAKQADMPVPSTQRAPAIVSTEQSLRTALPLAEPLAKIKHAEHNLIESIMRLPPAPLPVSRTLTYSKDASQLWRALNQVTHAVLQIKPESVPSTESIKRALNVHLPIATQHRTAADTREKAQPPLLAALSEIAALSAQLLDRPPAPLAQHKFSSLETLLRSLLHKATTDQPPAQKSAKTSNDQIRLQDLRMFAQKALAQTQLRQIQQLGSQATPLEQQHGATSHTVDVPLRLPDAWFNLAITVQAPKAEEKQRKKRTEQSRSQRWRLLLALELGETGNLTTELFVSDHQLDATLWADNAELREQAKEHIKDLRQQLTQQGLNVGDLVFSEAAPPELKNSNLSPLIDIET